MAETRVFIENITFNDENVFDFKPSDIVVFTGANNSGKSQLLRDIKNHFAKKNIKSVITKSITSNFVGEIKSLQDKCTLKKNGYYYLDNIYVISLNNLAFWWNNKDLSSLNPYFINHLSTENRLQAANPSEIFDAVEEYPNNPIQKLYVDDNAEKELSDLFRKAFGLDFIVNRGAGSKITIHVGDIPMKEDNEDRVSVSYLKKLKDLPMIQNQGDGMRSFLGILLETFTSNHSITLIDEPEAFLHPPQARLLGKMLAKSISSEKQYFISTHSEDFLKGLLDAGNTNIKIIRINREGNINHMNILNNEDIKILWNDPILRYSNILSGLFHSKVVICESDTDCRFYQAVLNSLRENDSTAPDILFTHCGGKQRLKTVVKALKSLNVKTVAIADIDILNDKNTFQEVVESVGMVWNEVESNWKTIYEYVRTQRAQLDTEEVKKAISEVFKDFKEPQLTNDIVDKLRKIIKMSSAWSKVKETGKNFLSGESYTAFGSLYEKCKANGLLIVPVGELECFYKPFSGHGVKWVNTVLENVDLKNDPELYDAHKFVNEILSI